MSKPINQTRFYQCGRKVLYLSENEAQRAADRVFSKRGVRLEPYKCPWCGNGWHLRKKKDLTGNL